MRGIIINNTHTGNDLGLILTGNDVGMPKPKVYKIEIPGRNGDLDMSEVLSGQVTYSNRTLTFTLLGNGTREVVLDLIDVVTAYNGQWVTIIVPDLPDWYYEGRVEVSYSDKYHYVDFTLTVDAQPFRKALYPKTITHTNITSQKLFINNLGINNIPTITLTAETTIINNDKTFKLSAGTYAPEELTLKTGVNSWIVTTTGTITINYREERL